MKKSLYLRIICILFFNKKRYFLFLKKLNNPPDNEQVKEVFSKCSVYFSLIWFRVGFKNFKFKKSYRYMAGSPFPYRFPP
jgi:hypothetical protein